MSEWNSPFIKGFSTCVTICSVIAGIAIYFNTTIVSLKDDNIERLEKKVSQQEDFSEKYHKEQAIRRQVEIREAEITQQLNIYISKKWEEKYLSEHLAKQSLEEKLSLLKTRNNDLNSRIKNNKQDPKKNLELKYLKEELRLAKKELSKLRELYTKEKNKPPRVVNISEKQINNRNSIYKSVMAAIPNMISSDIRDFIISTYKGTKRTITISQFANIASSMISSDILKTIKGISPHIINDGNPATLEKIVDEMISSDSRKALQYLMK